MRIVEIRERTIPISRYNDSRLPSGGLTTGLVAIATVDDLSWIPGTPLNHWASTPLSCVIQGQKVKKLFALHSGDIRGRAIFLFPDIWFRPRNRWFEFELSRQASSNS
jgi:hypothetical protein